MHRDRPTLIVGATARLALDEARRRGLERGAPDGAVIVAAATAAQYLRGRRPSDYAEVVVVTGDDLTARTGRALDELAAWQRSNR